MRKLTLLFLTALLCIGGCSSSSDDNDGQLSGDCSLKIINGKECPKGEGPVALIVAEDKEGTPLAMCSGSFIAQDKVLSAAHCGQLMDASVVKIYTGDLSHKAISFKKHPSYIEGASYNFQYDVGIFTLDAKVNVIPLPLLLSREVEVADTLYVYGFGLDEDDETAVDHDWGNSVRRTEMRVSTLVNGGIVAEYNITHSGACEGDSGGPALAKSTGGSYGIAGVVSGGTTRTCREGTLEVFTEMAQKAIIDFIAAEVPEVGGV